ncbi:MAG: pyruvate formate-lyase activating enzyme [Desulfobacteraceae bacterium]|nr:MAG: pyruvate formate-lyase activating enzyme [Desulfobacteraceae bacterium]
MAGFLILDIGAGTMDILYYDTGSGLHFKAVARSPALTVVDKAASLPGDLLVVGVEMGGGSLAGVLKERAAVSSVVMSRSASATVNHDPEKVRSLGIRIVDDQEAEELGKSGKFSTLALADLDLERIRRIVEGLDVPFRFDAVGVCAQDHGVPPAGVSHLDYRHTVFKEFLEKSHLPHTLLFEAGGIPETFHRLKAIGRTASGFPTDEVYVMDSGVAAILGASLDPLASGKTRILTLDVATSHTVGAALEAGEIAGFFEYHTRDITLEKIEVLLRDLAEGNLEHRKILLEGGHGAYVRKALGWDRIELLVATGPKRRMVEGSRLPITLGGPLGDNMMTGTAGVLDAVCRRKGMEPLQYT